MLDLGETSYRFLRKQGPHIFFMLVLSGTELVPIEHP